MRSQVGRTSPDMHHELPRLGCPGGDVRLTPFADGVENHAVLRLERVTHGAETLGCVGSRLVIAGWIRTDEAGAGAVGDVVVVVVGVVWDAENVLVSQIEGNVTVVVSEVVDAPFGEGVGVGFPIADSGGVAGADLCAG
jgi:hypothetical protein